MESTKLLFQSIEEKGDPKGIHYVIQAYWQLIPRAVNLVGREKHRENLGMTVPKIARKGCKIIKFLSKARALSVS